MSEIVMTIEDFEKEVQNIFERNISTENQQKIEWFKIEIESFYRKKVIKVISLIVGEKFSLLDVVIAKEESYDVAFTSSIESIKEKFGEN